MLPNDNLCILASVCVIYSLKTYSLKNATQDFNFFTSDFDFILLIHLTRVKHKFVFISQRSK